VNGIFFLFKLVRHLKIPLNNALGRNRILQEIDIVTALDFLVNCFTSMEPAHSNKTQTIYLSINSISLLFTLCV